MPKMEPHRPLVFEATVRGRPLPRCSARVVVEDLARWLAWSDRAMDAPGRSAFVADAERYWGCMTPNNRGRWVALAARLLGLRLDQVDANATSATTRARRHATAELESRVNCVQEGEAE